MPHSEQTAPAKVNLYLHVTGRNDDGYHLLQSLVVFTDFGDKVLVTRSEERPGIHLIVDGPFAHQIDGRAEDNLVWRALDGVRRLAGVKVGLTARLTKNLPVAAGIGGGSADAAAAMRAATTVLNTDIPETTLMTLAADLGADVPACLAGHPLYMQDIGTDIRRASVPAGLGIILVNPNQPVATPEIFGRFRQVGSFSTVEPSPPASAAREDWLTALGHRRNDLQPPAMELCPVIGDVLGILADDQRVLIARMSGSGATCFGLCDSPETARSVAETIARRSGWWANGGAITT